MTITTLQWEQIRGQFNSEEACQIGLASIPKIICADNSISCIYIINEAKLTDFVKLKLRIALLELTK